MSDTASLAELKLGPRWHWICRWSQWGKPFNNPHYTTPRQRRICLRCHKIQERFL